MGGKGYAQGLPIGGLPIRGLPIREIVAKALSHPDAIISMPRTREWEYAQRIWLPKAGGLHPHEKMHDARFSSETLLLCPPVDRPFVLRALP